MRSSLHAWWEWYEDAQLEQCRGVDDSDGGAQLM